MKTDLQTFPVLSIDAWGNPEEGYEWNQWFHVGSIDLDINNEDQDVIQLMIDGGYLKEGSKGLGEVEDDGFNLVILDKTTREPLFAIEYGSSI
jgi:hypothetical protein